MGSALLGSTAVRLGFAATAISISVLGAPQARAEPNTDRCLEAYVSAQRLQKKRELVGAKAELIVCAQSSCPGQIVKDCTAWLADVERRTPTLVVEVTDGSTRILPREVLVDGSAIAPPSRGAAMEVDPGERQLVVVLPGGKRLAQVVVVLEGEREKRVRFSLEKPAAAAGRDMLPVYAFGITGALALGSFTFFALRSHEMRSDLDACKGSCSEDAVNDVRREQIAADISLLVALVSGGAATYFALKPVEDVQVGAVVGAGHAFATLSRHF